MLQWLYKKNLDLKLRTIFCITVVVHVLLLLFIFFIYNYAAISVVVSTAGVPVVFALRTTSAVPGSGAGARKGSGIRTRKKVAQQKVVTRNKSRARFKSSYPVSSLKDRPKRQTSVTHPEPLFSPKKQDVQEVTPEHVETVKEQNDMLTLGEAQGEAQEASFYDPVYSALSQHWAVPAGLPKGLVCVVVITIGIDGKSTHEFVRKSGVLAFDTAVRMALLRAWYPQTIKQYTKKVEFRS